MLLSLVPFVFVELVNVVTSASAQRIVVLVALIITVAFLLAYFGYQVINYFLLAYFNFLKKFF